MDRRSFLRVVGAAAGTLGAGGLLAACGRDQGPIPAGEPGISVQQGSFEVLTGESRPVNLVVTENDATPIIGASLQVFLRSLEGEVRSGPYEVTYFPEEGEGTGTGFGLYQTFVSLPEPGPVEVVVVEGDRYGTAALNVLSPEQSQAPVPGAQAPVTATPTTSADLGVSPLCTEDPPCPLHEVSLDTALAEGRPVLLLFATPRWCQSTVCAPAVGNLVHVHGERDWGRVAFVHCEIYPNDAAAQSGQVAQPVTDWGLPTEPWLFAIDDQGVIGDRLDGPMLEADMRRLAEGIA